MSENADIPTITIDSPAETAPGGFRNEGGLAQPQRSVTQAYNEAGAGGLPEGLPAESHNGDLAGGSGQDVTEKLSDVQPEVEVASTTERGGVEHMPNEEGSISFAESINKALEALDNGEIETTPDAAPTEEPEAAEEKSEGAGELEQTPSSDDSDPTDDITTEDWTPKAAKAFVRLKAERKELRSEKERLLSDVEIRDKQIQELQGLMQTDNVDELKEQLEHYQHEQAFRDLENTQVYQETITEPLKQLMGIVDDISDRSGIYADELLDIMTDPDPEEGFPEVGDEEEAPMTQDEKLDIILEDATPRDKARVYRIMEEMELLLGERNRLYQAADDALKEAQGLEDQRVQQEAAEAYKFRTQATDVVVDRIKEKLPFLEGLEGMDLDKVKEAASSVDLGDMHTVDAQYALAISKMFPVFVKNYVGMQREVETLASKLAAFDNATPAAGGGAPAAPQGFRGSVPMSDAPQGASFAEAVDKALGGRGFGGV